MKTCQVIVCSSTKTAPNRHRRHRKRHKIGTSRVFRVACSNSTISRHALSLNRYTQATPAHRELGRPALGPKSNLRLFAESLISTLEIILRPMIAWKRLSPSSLLRQSAWRPVLARSPHCEARELSSESFASSFQHEVEELSGYRRCFSKENTGASSQCTLHQGQALAAVWAHFQVPVEVICVLRQFCLNSYTSCLDSLIDPALRLAS